MFNLLYKISKAVITYFYPTEKRKHISQKLRLNVWSKINGSDKIGHCYCCNDTLHIKNMHVAHAIPHAHGGTIELSNLYPTCMHCNLACGKTNLHVYKAKLKNK